MADSSGSSQTVSRRSWPCQFRLLTVCEDLEESANARAYLQRLIDDARLPEDTKRWVESGAFLDKVSAAPEADLSIFGLAEDVDKSFLEEVVRKTRSSCLFVRDSGRESALA